MLIIEIRLITIDLSISAFSSLKGSPVTNGDEVASTTTMQTAMVMINITLSITLLFYLFITVPIRNKNTLQ